MKINDFSSPAELLMKLWCIGMGLVAKLMDQKQKLLISQNKQTN